MATIAKVHGSQVVAVYDDKWAPLMAALGTVTIERASDVEYDSATGEWFAIYRGTGEEIARGANRGEVIAAEVRWLEERIAKS